MKKIIFVLLMTAVSFAQEPEAFAMGKMPRKTAQEAEATMVQTPVPPLLLEAAKILLKEEAFPPNKEVVYLTRVDVIRTALMRNLDILIARYDSKIEALELQKSKAVFDTLLTLNTDYERDELGRSSTFQGSRETTTQFDIGLEKTLPTGTTVELDFENERVSTNSTFATLNPSYDSRATLTLTQPIFKNQFGLLDRGEIDKVKFEISQMNEEVIERILEATAQVEKDYWTLVLAQEEEIITQEALKKAEALLTVNLDKYKRGLVEEVDLHASRANVALRQSDLAVAKNKTRSAIQKLKLGLNDFSGTVLLPQDRFTPALSPVDLEKSLKHAFQNRHDYRKARLEIEKNDLEIRLTENKRWPQLDLEASLTANGIEGHLDNALDEFSRGNQRYYFLGVSFELPLENREANANYKQSKLRKRQSLLRLQKTEREIFYEVEDQVHAVNTFSEKVRYTLEAEFLQKQKLEEEEKNFRMGRSDVNTLVDFQQDLLQARMQSARAYYEYYEAKVSLSLAEASLLDIGLDTSP